MVVLLLGVMRGNSTWTGRAGFGVRLGLPLGRKRAQAQRHILQVLDAHMHMAIARRRGTNVNTPNGAVGRILPLPSLARVLTNTSSSTEVDVSSPSDYLCDTTSAPPSASASISAFAFPSRMSTERQREYRHEYGLAISAPARPFSWFYGPAPMLVKERGRAISSLLYLDLALSRSFRNTPPNHNHHLKLNNHDRNRNQPNTVLQAHIHLLPVLQTGGYSNGYRYLCPCWVWGRC